MRFARFWILSTVLCWSSSSPAQTLTYLPVQSGHDEREEGGGGCPNESSFIAGVSTGDLNLKVGGETAGCNSEWATSIEFDLTSAPSRAVNSATLVVRKTGYSDDSQGFAYIGSFPYAATGSPVAVERDDLDLDTAMSIVYPPAANVDMAFDVTPAIQTLLEGGGTLAGLLLAGIYSEIGYETWISIASKSSAFPPRLVVDFDRTIGVTPLPWSGYKQFYR
jgi:hypothetical protein